MRKDTDVNEHERLSNITNQSQSSFIAVLHCTVTVGSSTMTL